MSTPPAWHADPTGRHEHRWWDGSAWTSRVADQGRESTDLLPPAAESAGQAGVSSTTAANGPTEPSGTPSRGGRTAVLIGAGALGLVLLVVLAVVITGGDDDSSAAEPGSPSSEAGGAACELLSTPQVSEATGQVMGDAEVIEDPSLQDGEEACAWESTEASASESIGSPLKVTATVGDVTTEVTATFDQVEEEGRGFRVDGLGEDALVTCGIASDIGPGCDSYGPLLVVEGDRFLTVELSNFATPDDFERDQVQTVLEDLARSATGNL